MPDNNDLKEHEIISERDAATAILNSSILALNNKLLYLNSNDFCMYK